MSAVGDRAEPGAPAFTDPATWDAVSILPLLHAMVAADELADIADTRDDVILLTADLMTANRLGDFATRHPDRFVNVGIAEHNMISMAAGLAACGFRPYVSTFASFAGVLGAEQIRTDLAFTGMPVRVLAHHAGVALGFYGTSHFAIEDLAFMRAIAGLVVTSVSDGPCTRAVIRETLDHPGPVYIRTGFGIEGPVYDEPPALERGRFVRVREGTDATVIATGIGVAAAKAAAEQLAGEGIDVAVLDAVYIKPFDEQGVLDAARATGAILTVEEHSVIGGLGGAVAEVLATAGESPRLRRHGFPDEFPPMGQTNLIHERYGLTPDGVAAQVRELIR